MYITSHQDEAMKAIDDLHQEGIIEPSPSLAHAWASPIVLVRWQYSFLPQVTIKDLYPLPRIHDTQGSSQSQLVLFTWSKNDIGKLECTLMTRRKLPLNSPLVGSYGCSVLCPLNCSAPASFWVSYRAGVDWPPINSLSHLSGWYPGTSSKLWIWNKLFPYYLPTAANGEAQIFTSETYFQQQIKYLSHRHSPLHLRPTNVLEVSFFGLCSYWRCVQN